MSANPAANISRVHHDDRQGACRDGHSEPDTRMARRVILWSHYLLVGLLFLGVVAYAGPREQAQRMHNRLAGVPPSAIVLNQMEALIADGDSAGAAALAMENDAFYNATLKNWIAPWTNEERDVFVPLNDYTATVIGMIRDDVPFNTLFSADILYVGSGSGLPPYSMTNNDHYEELEARGLPLQDALQRRTQSALTDLPPEAIAGIFTTRQAAQAYFIMGTNRAMFRFMLMDHMCRDLEQMQDTTRTPDRIRQDVSRSPGGDSRVFLNNCVSCHSGMDPMAGAFAFYDYDVDLGRIIYSANQVQPKYSLNNTTFAPGYITTDDGWVNYWREGIHGSVGWDLSLPGSGNGAASMGDELANSQEFASCQVRKVFRNVCLRDPVDGADRNQIDAMVAGFRAGGFRMKQVFAESAAYCMGE
ncbi:MAG: hypothetical protein AAGA68_04795 [Pseudomonadota bacterium]